MAAGLARRDLLRRLRRKPGGPVRPPAARMLFRRAEPRLVGAGERAARPILIFGLARRVDHAGDMPGARDDEADVAAEELHAGEDGTRRRDMVLARRQAIDRDLDVAQIDRLAANLQSAAR